MHRPAPWKAIAFACALATSLPTLPARCGASTRPEYVCPPCGQPCDTQVYDHPGVCPTCGMALIERAPGVPTTPAALPATGLDLSGVAQFWKITDLLGRDREPGEAQWRELFSTPGYRLAEVNVGPSLRDDIDMAIRPSRRAEFEQVTRASSDHGLVLEHLAQAVARRSDLVAFADSLEHSSVIADAVAMAARFLPPGATAHGPPPLVAVAIFRNDGYSLPGGIVIDLLNVRNVSLVRNLAHEFHHSYVNRLARPVPAHNDTAADEGLRSALYDLRNEGLADLIDKPYPFSSPNPALAGYAARYNQEYGRTPATIQQLDALLTAAADDPSRLRAGSGAARTLFWSNGHPNGAYMAREIQEAFGVDSLRSAALDPAVFLRIYASAEERRGRPNPLSAASWTVIERLDVKYWAH